jgi:hypothetical protein
MGVIMMPVNPDATTISILKTTRERLSQLMKHNQTYDAFLNELLDKLPTVNKYEVKQ